MLRGIANRAVGALALALFIIVVGGCGSSATTPVADGAKVTGVVLDQGTNLPVSDAVVRIGSITVHTDKVGSFVAVVPVGAYDRAVTAAGHQAYSDRVSVVAGDHDMGAVYLVELPPAPPQL